MTELEKAVESLLKKAAHTVNSAEALRFSQAALNVAHVKHVLAQTHGTENAS